MSDEVIDGNTDTKPIVENPTRSKSVKSKTIKNNDKRSLLFVSDKLLFAVVVLSICMNIYFAVQVQNLNIQNNLLSGTIDKLISSSGQKTVQVVQSISTNTTVDTKPIAVTIINDKRCTNCDITSLVTKLKSDFPTIVTTYLDYSDSSGKNLFDSAKLKLLPAVLFDNGITGSVKFDDIKQYLSAAGTYYSLAIGAQFDPACVTSSDCSNPVCANNMVCRNEIKDKLDIYVMSHCPYGVQAEQAFKPFFDMASGIGFKVHFIGSYDNSTKTFTSLHGPTEVDEDLRQVCIQNKYTESKFMNYVICRDVDITSAEWQKCALAEGMDTNAINTCATGDEGTSLLYNDMKQTSKLGIEASPTWIANNNKQFSALSTKDIQTQYCSVNIGAIGCSAIINSTITTPVAAGSCAT